VCTRVGNQHSCGVVIARFQSIFLGPSSLTLISTNRPTSTCRKIRNQPLTTRGSNCKKDESIRDVALFESGLSVNIVGLTPIGGVAA
jgi:hypothetical protein